MGVVVRCNSFNPVLWQYVADYARLGKFSRCDALQRIVQEHMRVVALEYQEILGKKKRGKKAKKDK